jgi:predicted GTPase
VFERFRHIGHILPAMGYGVDQLKELEATINATPCDVVVTGTPIDLGRLISINHPIRHATYEPRELGSPNLEDAIAPLLAERSAAAALLA